MERPQQTDRVAPDPSTLRDAFEALADPYRRRLLLALLEHNPQDDDDRQLPAEVTASDADSAVLRTQIVHQHLPKLQTMGFVDWDREADDISEGPRFEELRPLLELLDAHRDELPEGWL